MRKGGGLKEGLVGGLKVGNGGRVNSGKMQKG